MKTRLIPFLLLLALIVTAIPLFSFAAESEGDTTPAVNTMTEADYNALYVQDGLVTAFDVMVLNQYWNQPIDGKGVSFPVSPMLNESYEYPANSETYYDFTNCVDGYYADRFTGDENSAVFTYIKIKNDMSGLTKKADIQNLHTHVSDTKYTLADARTKVKELNAANDGYTYYVVGEKTSLAYREAIKDYTKAVNAWLASYTWAGVAPTAKVEYINFNDTTTLYKQLRDSFKAYAPFFDPVAGQGYLHTQYTYCDDSGIEYYPPTPPVGEATTLEVLSNVSNAVSGTFFILRNQRPTLANSGVSAVGTGFAPTNTTTQNVPLERNTADTIYFSVFNDITVENSTTDKVLIEQGNKTLYSATGVYTDGATNLIGFKHSFTDSRIYALRVYSRELDTDMKKQNHFADIAKWYRLDITGFERFSEGEKQSIYNAFAGETLDSKSRSDMQEIYDVAASEYEEKYAACDRLLNFDGYRAKLMEMPGLRSTYSIDMSALELLEEQGNTVIIGAMMTIAEGVATHDSLKAPLNAEGKYDRSDYENGVYSYITNGVAYQEIYNGGFVANLISRDEVNKKCEFAFTTVYGENEQTAENFQKGLLYRGFVVVTDEDGTETLLYTDMSSDLFDKNDNGAAITIYELSKVVDSDPEKYGANIDNEFIRMVIDAVEAPEVIVDPFESSKYKPEDYYALYVQKGLLLHLNFATANKGTAPIIGSDSYLNPEASAHERFTGAASNYNPFVVYSTVENPVDGGAAKILTPWYFENWYKNDFYTNPSLGKTGRIEDMQTEEPLEYVKVGDRNGTKVYIRNTNMYYTDFYYSDGIWVKQTYPSYWGNGFLGVGKKGILNVGRALNKDLANGYTVDIAFDGPTSYYYIGVRMTLSNTEDGAFSVSLQNGKYIQEDFETKTLSSTVVGATNTLTLAVETVADSKANLTLYGNAESSGTQTLAVGEVENLHQFCAGASDLDLYATRIYSRALTAEEVAQNHFADIAIHNQLDITDFLKLDDATKLEVTKHSRDRQLTATAIPCSLFWMKSLRM